MKTKCLYLLFFIIVFSFSACENKGPSEETKCILYGEITADYVQPSLYTGLQLRTKEKTYWLEDFVSPIVTHDYGNVNGQLFFIGDSVKVFGTSYFYINKETKDKVYNLKLDSIEIIDSKLGLIVDTLLVGKIYGYNSNRYYEFSTIDGNSYPISHYCYSQDERGCVNIEQINTYAGKGCIEAFGTLRFFYTYGDQEATEKVFYIKELNMME